MKLRRVHGMLVFWLFAEALFAAGEAPPPGGAFPLSTSHLMETLLGLLAVLAIMLGLAWLVRRFGRLPGNGQTRIEILGGVSLGTRERAVLVSVEGTRLLLGVSPGRVQTLHVMEGPARADQPFARTLEQTLEDKA